MYTTCQIFIKVRKYQKLTTFLILTFELCESIRKQNKTRLYLRVCLSWLGCAGETRVLFYLFIIFFIASADVSNLNIFKVFSCVPFVVTF